MSRPKPPPKWLLAARTAGHKPDDWLQRALERAGVVDAAKRIAEGEVKLDGTVTRSPFAPVPPGARVTVGGHQVDVRPVTRVMMLHKPKGVVTAKTDRHGDGTVFDVFFAAVEPAQRAFAWHAVGRLDRDTTGLLLFTTDERLVAHVTSPDTQLPKRYLATVGGTVTPEKLQTLARGVELSDGPTRPAEAALVRPGVVALTLREGRNHQVKRMLSAVGLPTLALHRESIGALSLDVAEGAVRPLTEDEVRTSLGFEPRGEATQLTTNQND